MTKETSLNEQLVNHSIELICTRGLENYSIRNVAAAAACSTTPITSRFKGKAGLLKAAQDDAYESDLAFHADISKQIAGMPINYITFPVFICNYVRQRSKLKIARFWSELLVKYDQGLSCKDSLKRWHDMRVDFWRLQLGRAEIDFHPRLACFVADYIVMEELYSYELGDDIRYNLLLSESVKSLMEKSFNAPQINSHGPVIRWLNNDSPDFPDFDNHERSELAERLLNLAGDAIRKGGIDALSQRTLTKKAGVSSAAIAYHFGNMANFTNEALWHVLLRELPAQFDPNKTARIKQTSLTEWVQSLRRLTRSKTEEKAPGFYNEYSRLTGQACLLARRDNSLLPLIKHLRQIDGWGTYRSGNTYWPDALHVDRGNAATFGIWIKGRAVLQDAFSAKTYIPESDFTGIAAILL